MKVPVFFSGPPNKSSAKGPVWGRVSPLDIFRRKLDSWDLSSSVPVTWSNGLCQSLQVLGLPGDSGRCPSTIEIHPTHETRAGDWVTSKDPLERDHLFTTLVPSISLRVGKVGTTFSRRFVKLSGRSTPVRKSEPEPFLSYLNQVCPGTDPTVGVSVTRDYWGYSDVE